MDSTDKRRFEEAKLVLTELLDDDKLTGVPVLVYANKQDLVHAATASDVRELTVHTTLFSSTMHRLLIVWI